MIEKKFIQITEVQRKLPVLQNFGYFCTSLYFADDFCTEIWIHRYCYSNNGNFVSMLVDVIFEQKINKIILKIDGKDDRATEGGLLQHPAE